MDFGAAAYIGLYKETSEDKYLLKIIEAFSPMINKYAKKFAVDIQEDVRQELILALIGAIRKMKRFDSDGECICYIEKSIKNQFCKIMDHMMRMKKLETSGEEFLEQEDENARDELEE